MRVYFKNVIIGFMISLSLIILFSCSKDSNKSVMWRETEVDSVIYNDFKSSLNDRDKLIPVEIHGGKIYIGNRLLYMDDVSAAADGLRLVNMLSQSFLLNKNKKQISTTYEINPFLFSEDIQRIILTVDGSKWDDRANIDEKYFDIINSAGLYSISGTDEEIIKVLDKELLFKYCKERYDGTWINVGGITDIDKMELIAINDELKLNVNNTEDVDNIYKPFVIKNEGTFPEYRNYFNKGGYTVIDGFIVQNQVAIDYMNTLSAIDRADYQVIEKEVFKLNNKSAEVFDDKTYTTAFCKKGEFLSDGKPAWVTRVNGEMTTDIYGNSVYAFCSKTFDEFSIYCGGTDIAFHGWAEEVIKNPDELYNSILRGRGTWDDVMFVDEQVKYAPVRNDDPKYYEEYIEMMKVKEQEDLENRISDLLKQAERDGLK